MVAFSIDPLPDMERQVYGPGGIIHDLTCGRYCLKSLLKYWHERAGNGRITRLNLTGAVPFLANWYGFSPLHDYEHAYALLRHRNGVPPTRAVWLHALLAHGPIILMGRGIGGGFAGFGPFPAIRHSILLTGIRTDDANATFRYLDPLMGNQVQTAPWAMQRLIEPPIVYGAGNIRTLLGGIAHRQYYTRP